VIPVGELPNAESVALARINNGIPGRYGALVDLAVVSLNQALDDAVENLWEQIEGESRTFTERLLTDVKQ
jgi:hypothetical protein